MGSIVDYKYSSNTVRYMRYRSKLIKFNCTERLKQLTVVIRVGRGLMNKAGGRHVLTEPNLCRACSRVQLAIKANYLTIKKAL